MANVPNIVKAIGDKISTTLTNTITAGATTITVASGAGMNSTGGYIIIDPGTASEEIVYIESVSGNTLTVATNGRGRGATVATGHSAGAVVTDIITNEMFNRIHTTISNEHDDDGTHKTQDSVFTRFTNNGKLMDGAISVSVASNNLTVSMVCADGTTPSATRPIRVVINGSTVAGTIRQVTSALTMTLNGGTDWWAHSQLGTGSQTFDLIVFAIYDSVGGAVQIGLARANLGTTYSNYSTTSTAYNYIAISGGTPASGDRTSVIGRITVTTSSTNFTAASNSISFDQGVTNIRTYTPTVSASGSMTVSSTVVNYARYQITGQLLTVLADLTFTLGGTASNQIYITPPMSSALSVVIGSCSGTLAAGSTIHQAQMVSAGNRIEISTISGANWTLGSTTVRFNITYPLSA